MTISRLIRDKKTINWEAISKSPPKIAKLENCMDNKREGIKIGKAKMDNIPILLLVLLAMALTIVRVEEMLVLPNTTANRNIE